VNLSVLQQLNPKQVEVEIRRADAPETPDVPESELDVPMLDCMRLKAMSNFL